MTLRPAAALAAALLLAAPACGRKGDPVPRPRALPAACAARLQGLRRLVVTLPRLDAQGAALVGVERVRVYHLALGAALPRPAEVLARGDVVLERSRPDLPGPGGVVELDLSGIQRPRGWLVVAAVRVGGVVGDPGEILPWLDPEL